MDFKQNVIVTGIATQGFSGVNDYYVKQYKVVYSRDGVRWNSTKKVTNKLFHFFYVLSFIEGLLVCAISPV